MKVERAKITRMRRKVKRGMKGGIGDTYSHITSKLHRQRAEMPRRGMSLPGVRSRNH